MTIYRNDKGRFRSPKNHEKDIDIRKESDIEKLETLLKNGNITFILIYADWCGHCHRYIPTWSDLEKTPGRIANMARVHYDMQEKIPTIQQAKIQGYPSVIKVLPDGTINSYDVPESSEKTNAMPKMRDIDAMKKELTSEAPVHRGGGESIQRGGTVMNAFMSAIQQAAPAVLLMLANQAMQSKYRTKTFRSPKRFSKRAASTRRRFRRQIRN